LSASRYSIAFNVGRDYLFALLIGAVATLVTLNIQLAMTKQALREDSLDRAARYIADHLQIDPSGEAHLATPPGSSSASIDYQAVVFDRNGRILFEQPARLDPELAGALSERRLAADRGHRPGAGWFFYPRARALPHCVESRKGLFTRDKP
jgi:hypothetical protein